MSTDWTNLLNKLKNCNKCSTIDNNVKPVFGYGHRNAKVLIIGLAPGRNGADQTGIPFTRDPSGQLLQEALTYSGINRERDIFITNIVKCNPRDKKGRNRTPNSEEIHNCSAYLSSEIELIHPKIIVPLGSKAIKYVLNEKGVRVTKLHGTKIVYEDRIIFPFIHPGYVIRGSYDKQKYLEDFLEIGNELRKQLKSEREIPRSEILLLTLFNDNLDKSYISGRTKLQKIAFYAQKELMDKGFESIYGFRPYHYGPYSREVYTDITWLEMNKLVEVCGKIDETGSMSEFKLTKRGFDYAKSLLKKEEFERIYSIINRPLVKYKKMSVTDLVEYTHDLYPNYDLNQIKKEKSMREQTLDKFMKET